MSLQPPVKINKNKLLSNLKSKHSAIKDINDAKLNTTKNKLIEQKKEISCHRATWQGKLDKLNKELESASDHIYLEKRKGGISMQGQIDAATKTEHAMQNYIDELEEGYAAQSIELKSVLKSKRSALKSNQTSKLLAAAQLKKWHDKRNKNRSRGSRTAK